MATKKKSKKPTKKLKKPAAKKVKAVKKVVSKKAAPKAATKAKSSVKKPSARKPARASKKKIRGDGQNVGSDALTSPGLGARSAGQSGSLQGLSDKASADSESVDELVEEGNAFEAEAVEGVEDALDPDQGEVHTHEVPEDDVPEEYEDQ